MFWFVIDLHVSTCKQEIQSDGRNSMRKTKEITVGSTRSKTHHFNRERQWLNAAQNARFFAQLLQNHSKSLALLSHSFWTIKPKSLVAIYDKTKLRFWIILSLMLWNFSANILRLKWRIFSLRFFRNHQWDDNIYSRF